MIIRNPDRDGFVIISKDAVEDERLSWGARGLHHYLLSKPDGWQVIVVHLVKQSPKGRTVVEGLLDELEKFGYIVRSGYSSQQPRALRQPGDNGLRESTGPATVAGKRQR